ncbi:MAG: HAMP domain-containing histidine kinase [Gemmatimonadota bacterium]|nr:HAMP domain-containing histidine kinase [Gemmatimonadota bacterium]
MTPRARLAGKLRSSFFLKILLVFVGGGTAIGAYLMASFWVFDWQQGRLSVRQTALNYSELILGELGHPPDTVQAREIATRLGVGIRIAGPDVDWTSEPDFPAFADVDLPPATGEGPNRAGLSRALGVGADLSRGEYRYLFSLQAGRTAFGTESTTEEVADALFMLVLLVCLYLATRYLLRPVRVLTDGVERLRQGDLDVEMQTRRTDELGRLMTSFNEMAGTIRERIRARDRLLMDVSHEIRSPLTRMRVALAMMPDGAARSSVIEDIEETEAMISELLETERLDSPHGGLTRAPVDLRVLIEEAVAARAGEPPGVEVDCGVGPIVANVDGERVRVVLGNLLTNALRHSDPDGPPVRVALNVAGEEIRIGVHDQGVGIATDDQARVFEPFYRVDRSRSKDTGGYGIGLSLVKRIVEAHGGAITLESEPGRGTSVTVSLSLSGNGQRRGNPHW